MFGQLARWLTLATTGLLGGAFLYGTIAVNPTFRAVPIDVHLSFRTTLMQQNARFMQALMAVAVLAALSYAVIVRNVRRARWLAAGASAMALVCLLVTKYGNVPINLEIKTWTPTRLPVDYVAILDRWELFHDIRSVAAIASFVLALLAVEHLGGRRAASVVPGEGQAVDAVNGHVVAERDLVGRDR